MDSAAERLVSIGRIHKPHGVHGAVKVEPLTDDPGRFGRLRRVFCALSSGEQQTLTVVEARPIAAETVLVRFAEYPSPEAAAALRGAELQIPRSECPPLPEGKFYFADLIGLRAFDQGTSQPIGTVTAIARAGNDLLVIATPQGKEILVPWVDAFVARIDPARGELWLTPVPGLLDG